MDTIGAIIAVIFIFPFALLLILYVLAGAAQIYIGIYDTGVELYEAYKPKPKMNYDRITNVRYSDSLESNRCTEESSPGCIARWNTIHNNCTYCNGNSCAIGPCESK